MVAMNDSMLDVAEVAKTFGCGPNQPKLLASSATEDESDPKFLLGLDKEQRRRLTDLLDRYLISLEKGDRLDAAELKRRNPDLAEPFEIYLTKLDALYGVSVGFQVSETIGAVRPAVGMLLGDFLIQREIGRGGMGVVYEANQQSLGRRVAIKLLPLASLLDATQIARFKNEAHAAGLLDHPHIVPVHSVGSDQGLHYYAMQYIDGVSMDDWIAGVRNETNTDQKSCPPSPPLRGRGVGGEGATGMDGYCIAPSPPTPLPHEARGRGEPGHRRNSYDRSLNFSTTSTNSVLQWGIDIADALHVAHVNGVIHRDVKPSNLMLDKSGKIWITDFGLARCQNDVSLTRSGDVIGTMRYMSPEQARGQSALIDGRADVYSLAATLYEMLALRPAHEGDDAATILQNIDQREVTPLRQLRPDLPRDLQTVIAKAMGKRRDDRYETAHEFAEDLGRVLAGEPTLARPPTAMDRIVRLASKHHRAASIILLFVTFALGGLAVANTKLATAKAASDANAARALRGEQLARGAVDQLGSQMAELLDDIPAASGVRRQLLSGTLDYYQRFASELGDDPKLQQDLATTLGKMGSLRLELGDRSVGVHALTQSEAIYSKLASEKPFDTELQLHWATSQNNLAEALVRDSQMESAASLYARALSTLHRSAKQPGEEAVTGSIQLAMASTLNNIGLMLAEVGGADEAERRYVEAIEILRGLVSPRNSEPTALAAGFPAVNPRLAPSAQLLKVNSQSVPPSIAKNATQQLSAVRTNLSGLLVDRSPDQAVQIAKEALDGQLETLRADRGNAKLAAQTIVTLNILGQAQSAAGQANDATSTFERSIEIGEQLLQRWPDQPTYRRDLVLSHNHLGLALAKAGRVDDAIHSFQNAQCQRRSHRSKPAGQ